MKILSTQQIKALDAYTIQTEGISSLALMERAAIVFADWFVNLFPDTQKEVIVLCGTGNNGGDGFAVARILYQRSYSVKVYWCQLSADVSQDCQSNYERLPPHKVVPVTLLKEGDDWEALPNNSLVIDAILGSGLNRGVSGYWAKLFEALNQANHTIVSIDIPSGLFADQVSTTPKIQANYCLSFEQAKLAFLFPENYTAVQHWTYKSIGLSAAFIAAAETSNYYIDRPMVRAILKTRTKYDHKGNFGHALLIAGSYGKVGAAVLAAEACLRSGTGLLTVHAPACAYPILQTRIPEAMISVDEHQQYVSRIPPMQAYAAIGIGCGLSTSSYSLGALDQLLIHATEGLIIDADALNIIARRKWHFKIPRTSIITPHPKEFERLFGPSDDNFARNELQRNKAKELGIYIILKGAHTCIATPDGQCYFNSTGNPGMATAGSGDVLTGILTGLKAQGYTPLATAILGVYLHGLAGDIALEKIVAPEALLASDLTTSLAAAFTRIRS